MTHRHMPLPIARLWSVMLTLAVVMLLSSPARADTVVPSDDVTTRVVVRASASSQSAQLGSLRPGESLELVGSVPNWHEVQLANGSTGFVSKRWTRVIPAGASPPVTPPTTAAPTFELNVVDVGTGLAVWVQGPDFTLIYDAGSNDDMAVGPANRMVAYLKARIPMLTTIDAMLLSHPHQDHVLLLPDLFAAYQVRQVWDSGRLNDICAYRAFLTAVQNEPGVQYHNALQDFGTRDYTFAAKSDCPAQMLHLTFGSRITDTPIPLGQHASMTILHADGANHASANENSLVVRLDLGTTRVLLMGDAQGGGRASPATPPTVGSIEETLVTCCASALASQVMVVGHHGSRTSSRKALLDAVGASIFLVSSGPRTYGTVVLPDADVIAELQSRGIVFRTDVADASCATNPAKIGPDNDGRPGGCENIRVVLSDGASPQVEVWHGSEP